MFNPYEHDPDAIDPAEEAARRLDGEETDRDSPYALLGQAISEIVRFQLYGEGKQTAKFDALRITRRTVATAAILSPTLVQEANMSDLGGELACTRANMSHIIRRLCEKFGTEINTGKTVAQRATYQICQTKRNQIVRTVKRLGKVTARGLVQRAYFENTADARGWCEREVERHLLIRQPFKPKRGREVTFYALK